MLTLINIALGIFMACWCIVIRNWYALFVFLWGMCGWLIVLIFETQS